MTRTTTAIAATLLSLILLMAAATCGVEPAEAKPKGPNVAGPCRSWKMLPKHGLSTAANKRRTHRLLVCVFPRFGQTARISWAMYIIGRESNYDPSAVNTSSKCAGLAQHHPKYWRANVRKYLGRKYHRRWFNPYPPSALNPRANIWVMAGLLRDVGTGPWATREAR